MKNQHCLPNREEYEKGAVPIQCSGWPPEQSLPAYPPLEQDCEADVVVVGLGLAGASLTLHLAEQGVSVIGLETRQPANGASGRNAGHVQTYLDNLTPLKTWPGQGNSFLEFFIQHRDIVFDLCRKHDINGDACKSGMLAAALKKQPGLEQKAKFWKAHGYDLEVVNVDRLGELLGTRIYQHGLHWREGGRVNPYLFTQGMARAATNMGARIHGDSSVMTCERVGQRWRVTTPRGSVLAEQVVLCTNGHGGNAFFSELARTQYPLVACGLTTGPLPTALLDQINPTRAALTQVPAGLYPLVIDGRNRLVTATIPGPGKAWKAEQYFGYLLRYLHRTFPQTQDAQIELESYWTGLTASSSHIHHADYPKLYRVADGVLALMNLGTWGNVMGPQLGMHLAQVLAKERFQDLVLPLEAPSPVRFPGLFDLKIRRLLIPLARLVDRMGMV